MNIFLHWSLCPKRLIPSRQLIWTAHRQSGLTNLSPEPGNTKQEDEAGNVAMNRVDSGSNSLRMS